MEVTRHRNPATVLQYIRDADAFSNHAGEGFCERGSAIYRLLALCKSKYLGDSMMREFVKMDGFMNPQEHIFRRSTIYRDSETHEFELENVDGDEATTVKKRALSRCRCHARWR